HVSQCVEGRRWCPWAREGLEEARVFAGDAPCHGEEIYRVPARIYARQTVSIARLVVLCYSCSTSNYAAELHRVHRDTWRKRHGPETPPPALDHYGSVPQLL